MTGQCGKCGQTFLLRVNEDTIACPQCKTIYQRQKQGWICEYSLTFNAHSVLNISPKEIPLNQIKGPYPVNKSIEELKQDIKRFGLEHPIVVRRRGPKKYSLIDGNRRLSVARSLGWNTIPCLITPEPERL